jgi:hypothetical protein
VPILSDVERDIDSLRQWHNQLKQSSDGVRLLKEPEDNPICAISVDQSIPAVVVVWKQYTTSAQIRFIHEYLLLVIKKHLLRKILGDDTELVTIHEEDQNWIANDWMPRAISAGIIAGASKRPLAYFGDLAVKDLRESAPPSITIRAFDHLENAREWLKGIPVENS